ncbi:MAG: DUF4338 domain-containing protein [Fimbriimonadales bacterium]|nr:DUF4338 domain-containing protein [Fimbriimonadales bacterium]
MMLYLPDQIDLHELQIAPVRSRSEVRAFLDAHHYLGGRGVPIYKHALGVWAEYTLVGVGVFGRPCARQECRPDTLELRRYCLLDSLPRNAESYCLSRMLRWLKARGYRRVITYADPSQGHTGGIYKAVGFYCVGMTGRGNWGNRPYRRSERATAKLKFVATL